MLICKYCHLVLANGESVCPLDGGQGEEVAQEPLETKLSERFKGVEPFAQGHTGSLYRAEDLMSGRRGLLKVLRFARRMPAAKWARFVRDLDKQKSLSDQHVASVFDAGDSGEGDTGSYLWLFRPLLEGEPLSVRLKRERTLKVPEVLAVVAQIATGLDAIHRAGLLHRDLKPGHVILRPQPSGVPFVTLIDTGIAAPIETKSLFDLVGTAAYVSPEHASGKAVSFRSDLYALGCILYEMLTGEPPFIGNEIDDLLRSHQERPFAPLQLQLPEPVAALAASLLAKEPRGRPFSAQQVRRTLEPCLPEFTPAARASRSVQPTAPRAFSAPPPKTAFGIAPVSNVALPPAGSSRRSVPLPPAPNAPRRSTVPPPMSTPAAEVVLMTEAEMPLEELRSIPQPPAADAPRRSTVPPPIHTPTRDATNAPILTNDAEVTLEEIITEDLSTDLVSSSSEDIAAPLQPVSIATEDHPIAAASTEDLTMQLQPVSITAEDHKVAASVMDDEATQVLSHRGGISYRDAVLSQQYLAQAHAFEAPDGETDTVTDDRDIDDIGCAAGTGGSAPLVEPPEQATIPLTHFAQAATGAVTTDTDQAINSRAMESASESALAETSPVAVADAPPLISDSEGTELILNRQWSLPRKLGVLALTTVTAAVVVYGALRWSEPKKATVVGSAKPVVQAKPIHSVPSKVIAAPAKPQVQQPKAPEPAAAAAIIDTPKATAAVDAAVVTPDSTEEKKASSTAAVEDNRGSKKQKSVRGRAISKTSSGASLAKRSSKVEAIKEKARAHFQAGRYSAAAAAYKEATRLEPSNAGSFAGLGASLIAIHDSDGAIAAYQRAIQLSPKSSGYHAALGRTYGAKGDKARAIKAYKKAVEIDPKNRVAQNALKRLTR
jgi:serine/threonine protein kinase/Flp pilus assembly protein TadD